MAILRELQADGRVSNQDLADRVGLSPSPCLRRVRQLERRGIVTGYAAIVDQHAYGLPVTAFVQLRLERHSPDAASAVESRLREIDHVQECFLMAGDTDYLLRVVVDSLESYERLVRERIRPIPGIASIQTSFAFGVVKRRGVLPDPPRPPR